TKEISIYLKLTENEQCTLLVALRQQLESHGVHMCHEKIVEQKPEGFHHMSHIGTIVKLYQRIDAAYHGRKTWNADWREREPYCNLESARRELLCRQGAK